MVTKQDIKLIVPYNNTGEELAMVYAQCKCQKCGLVSNLQYHHIITKYYKGIMDYWKYITQRHYWANILILCKYCHRQMDYHNNTVENGGVISTKFIEKIKLKYSIV